ncbi:hypothetical protein VPH35_096178 [Triticum aestivum]
MVNLSLSPTSPPFSFHQSVPLSPKPRHQSLPFPSLALRSAPPPPPPPPSVPNPPIHPSPAPRRRFPNVSARIRVFLARISVDPSNLRNSLTAFSAACGTLYLQ